MELAFERYVTSRITTAGDLERITTLGFRGEALPSIAAVAQVELLSCTDERLAGGYLKLKNGRMVERGSRACPRGTIVTVRDLFRNVPARLKFLKSSFTENSHINHLVIQYSLALPSVTGYISPPSANPLKP